MTKYLHLFLLILIAEAHAATYECYVERSAPKNAPLVEITVYEREFTSSISHCIVGVEKGCSLYQADKVVFNEHLKSKKFYNLVGQSDFQLFSDLTFIDNDGQGILRYGKCVLVTP